MSAQPTVKQMFEKIQTRLDAIAEEVASNRREINRIGAERHEERGRLRKSDDEIEWLRRQIEARIGEAS